VHAADVWILRLDPAWQFVAIVSAAAASALVGVRPPASLGGHTRIVGGRRAYTWSSCLHPENRLPGRSR